MEELIRLARARNVQFETVVIVVIAPCDCFNISDNVKTDIGGHIGKGPIAVVAKQLANECCGAAGPGFGAYIQIEPAVSPFQFAGRWFIQSTAETRRCVSSSRMLL